MFTIGIICVTLQNSCAITPLLSPTTSLNGDFCAETDVSYSVVLTVGFHPATDTPAHTTCTIVSRTEASCVRADHNYVCLEQLFYGGFGNPLASARANTCVQLQWTGAELVKMIGILGLSGLEPALREQVCSCPFRVQ